MPQKIPTNSAPIRPDWPDTENTMSLLREWMAQHDAVKRLLDGIDKAVGLEPEGPLFETVWRLFDAYTDTLSVELGDYQCWLAWWNSENDCGRRGLNSGYDGQVRQIKSLDDLCWLIETGRGRV